MPTYVYRCPAGHVTEHSVPLSEWSRERSCECGQTARQIIQGIHFTLSWDPRGKAPDTAKEIWEGTPLEGTDGKNRETYKSKKITLDMGGVSENRA